jgi:hypothetical protein
MKANELMTGNWVTGKKWRENPFKLTRINDNGKYCYGITSNGTQVGPFLPEEIEPVPITAEILEKNGFEKSYSSILTADGYKKLPQYKYKNIAQAQNICRNLIIISYSDLDGGVYDIQCGIGSHIYDLKYVHQLQHALRLCGIDKTIEL